MSVAFTAQLSFDWAQESVSQVPVVAPAPAKNAVPVIKKAPASATSVNLGVPATAKSMDEILASPNNQYAARRNRTDHISDLLLVVLDKYGISADEFMATLND